jgi:hypothetical protein
MDLRVIGVGLGRTGTNSLKLALEHLLGAPCHHMLEMIADERQFHLWLAALGGEPDWDAIYEGYVATVDWPGTAFWRELVAACPDAIVLLSRRETAEAWWTSARRTIFAPFNDEQDGDDAGPRPGHLAAVLAMFARNGIDPRQPEAAMAAYDAHLAAVRAEVPVDRLVEWIPGDGWGPLCDALHLPVPDRPFPHVNTTEEFRDRRESMTGRDP